MPTFKNKDKKNRSETSTLSEFIASVGKSVAKAQKDIDSQSIQSVIDLHSKEDEETRKLKEFGFQPPWYRIPEVNVEVMMSLTLDNTSKVNIYATPVNAGYSNAFNYSTGTASCLKFKLISVPEPVDSKNIKIVPALTGKILKEVYEILSELGIEYTFENNNDIPDENSVLADTQPSAGAILKQNEKVVLIV